MELNFKKVAMTIIEQLGGYGKLKSMVGMDRLAWNEKDKAFYFRFKGNSQMNYCMIQLDEGKDLYNMVFYRVARGKSEEKRRFEGIGAEQLKPLFEETTRLYINL